MTPYILVTVVVAALALLSSTVSRSLVRIPLHSSTNLGVVRRAEWRPRWWTPFDFIAVGILVSFSALRFQVGTDYRMYFNFYQRADPSQDWAGQVDYFQQEALYTWMSLALKSLTDSPYAIFWAAALLSVVPVYATLRKQSQDLSFSILLYILLSFYIAPFNIVRQGIAVALLFWAYSFLRSRSWVPFVILGIIAAMFHISAALAIPIMLVARLWKPGPRSTLIALASAGLGSAVLWGVPAVADFVSSLNPRYGNYLAESDAAGFGTYMLAAAFVALVLLVIVFRQYNDRTDWLAFLVIATAFVTMGTQSVVPTRMFHYFGIFAILLIPNTLSRRPGSSGVKFAVLLGAGAFFIFYLLNWGDLLPYSTYMDPS